MATIPARPDPASEASHFSAAHLSGHFIICGLDELGFRLSDIFDRPDCTKAARAIDQYIDVIDIGADPGDKPIDRVLRCDVAFDT